jgi:hypothetical protein
MRRLFLILATLAALLAAPVGTLAAHRGSGDGTVSLKNANGVFVISGKGAVIGQLDRGRVTIVDPISTDGPPAIVTGYEHSRDLTDKSALYAGTDVSFRMIGGTFKIQISGKGVDLSFVGRGVVTVVGLGTADDGKYSVDGGDTYRATPLVLTTLNVPPATNSMIPTPTP